MENLPMNKKNSIFLKIKNFLKKIFSKKTEEKESEYSKKERDIKYSNTFQEDIKAIIGEKEALEKIDNQNRRNELLKKFADNQELIKKLSMDELIKLEKLYDEELAKMTDNNN